MDYGLNHNKSKQQKQQKQQQQQQQQLNNSTTQQLNNNNFYHSEIQLAGRSWASDMGRRPWTKLLPCKRIMTNFAHKICRTDHP